jgi:hypothetical protein
MSTSFTPYIVYYHSFTEDVADGWTWLKWPAIPSEEDREAIKGRYQACFSRKRLAWYIKDFVEPERLALALGREAEGVIEGQRPIKAWPKGFRSV